MSRSLRFAAATGASLWGSRAPGSTAMIVCSTCAPKLLAEYRFDAFRLGADLFDSRAYGADPSTPISTNEVNTLELVQACVAGDISEPFGKGSKLGLMAGRFTLNFG